MNEFLYLSAFSAGIAIILFVIVWVIARRIDNYSIVDIAWSYALTPLVLWYAYAGTGDAVRKGVAVALGLFWSLRLGTYLLKRIARHHPHEDVRYEVLREKWKGKLGAAFFWFFQAQAVLILLLSIPLLLACMNSAPGLNLIEWIGIAVWLVGVGGEALSDAQMARFKADPANKGKVCRIGLWGWSRHPNYFFESVLWFGFWLFACGSPWGWVTVYAPLMILYFLLRVTGIPLTEECAVKSKGEAYRDYQRTTSAFIPLPPRRHVEM
jgi:steroid 5-alpha reductase family enzyme